MMHPEIYVAQTTAAHVNHFYCAVLGALEYEGPSLINTFTSCQPEHGVADDMAAHQGKACCRFESLSCLYLRPTKG